MNPNLTFRTLAALILMPFPVIALEATPQQDLTKEEEAIHDELRQFRKNVVEAMDKQDVEGMLSFVTKDVVVTWQTGEVVRGHQGLRDFFKRVQERPEKLFQSYKVPPTPDELTVLYNKNTGVSWGMDTGIYKARGTTFEMTNRWTVTLIKEGDKWLVASYHVSASVTDNPVLDAVKSAMTTSIVISGIVGIVLALVGMWIMRKLKPSATPKS